MNHRQWLWIFVLSLILMAGNTRAAIDPAVVGTWRFADNSHADIKIWSWIINADGTYRQITIGSNNTPDETGTMEMDKGSWSLHASSGRADSGSFKLSDPETIFLTGKTRSTIWIHHHDGKGDPQFVGTWRSVAIVNGQPSVYTRTNTADGRYTGSANAQDVGQLTIADGKWNQNPDKGRPNFGIYKIIDSDTMTMRGRLGWTVAWYRAPDETPPPVAAVPKQATPVTPPTVAQVPPPAVTATQPPPTPAEVPPAPPQKATPVAADPTPAVAWSGAADDKLTGAWVATDGNGISIAYIFHNDGTLTMEVGMQQFKQAFPNGIVCKYTLRKASPNWEMDLDSTDAAHSVSVKGIFSRISEDQFKMEGPSTGDARPADFTSAASLFFRSKGAATAGGPVTASTGRAQTFAQINHDFGGDIACIKTDGTLWIESQPLMFGGANTKPPTEFPIGTFAKVDGVTKARSLWGDDAIAQATDGSWWDLHPGQQAVPSEMVADSHVIGSAQGYNMMLWILQGDGTAALLRGAAPGEKPGLNLDKITKLIANYNQSMHVTLLRSDGTVWVDASNINGSVTANGYGSAKPIQGLDHVKDVSVFSPYFIADTGVALKEDGSVLYWGMPFVQDTGQGLPAPTTPEIKTLAKPARAIRVAAGRNCCAAVDTDGHVWVWGGWPDARNNGKTFCAAIRGKDVPADPSAMDNAAMIDGLDNIVDIKIDSRGAFALSKDGSLWAWSGSVPPRKICDGVKVPD